MKYFHFRRKDAFWKGPCWPLLQGARQLSIYFPVWGQISPLWLCLCCRALFHVAVSFPVQHPEGDLCDTHMERTRERSAGPPPVARLHQVCDSIVILMELLPPVTWWEPFVNVIPQFEPRSVHIQGRSNKKEYFSVLCLSCTISTEKVEAYIYYQACFSVAYRQSQILAGTYSDRYFYSIHSIQTGSCSGSLACLSRWVFKQLCSTLSEVMPWRRDMGELAMLHCHPGHCWQTRFILWSLLGGKDASEHPEQWPVAQCWTTEGQTGLPCEG